MAGVARSVTERILDSSMGGSPFIAQDEVLPQKRRNWGPKCDWKASIGMVNQQSKCCRCE
jgi:hypothetical protein